MTCPYHPDGDCPMQRLADHAVNITPAGLHVVVLVGEETKGGAASHFALATRTRGVDVPDLLRHFADHTDQRHAVNAADAMHAPGGALRIRADLPLRQVRERLEAAREQGMNAVLMHPDALLRLLNEAMS